MKLDKHQKVYVRSMGKLLEVTAIFTDDKKANKYQENNKDQGVIACYGDAVFIANLYSVDKTKDLSK